MTIFATERPEKSLSEVISEQMNRIYFPVQLHELKAKIHFRPIKDEGEIQLPGCVVKTMYVNHPGFTLGYRLEYKGKSFVYISDNEPYDREAGAYLSNFEPFVKQKFNATTGDPNRRVFEFCRGADVLVHDATYTPEEYIDRIGWGHSHYLFTLGAVGTLDGAIGGALTLLTGDQSTSLAVALTARFFNYLTSIVLGGYALSRQGETLSGIAQRCGTTAWAILEMNPGIGWNVYTGQVLKMPGGHAQQPTAYPTPAIGGTYTVKWGDTLGKIAARYNVSLRDLLAVNRQIPNPDLIYPWQVINLPAYASKPPAYPTPKPTSCYFSCYPEPPTKPTATPLPMRRPSTTPPCTGK